jgi:hypothetical protein
MTYINHFEVVVKDLGYMLVDDWRRLGMWKTIQSAQYRWYDCKTYTLGLEKP